MSTMDDLRREFDELLYRAREFVDKKLHALEMELLSERERVEYFQDEIDRLQETVLLLENDVTFLEDELVNARKDVAS